MAVSDDYLTRLQAQRAALNERALAAAPAVLLICPHCHGEFRRNGSGVWYAECACPGAPLSIVTVIAELDRAIAWAKQTAGWRERV